MARDKVQEGQQERLLQVHQELKEEERRQGVSLVMNGAREPDDKGHRKDNWYCMSSSVTRISFRDPRP